MRARKHKKSNQFFFKSIFKRKLIYFDLVISNYSRNDQMDNYKSVDEFTADIFNYQRQMPDNSYLVLMNQVMRAYHDSSYQLPFDSNMWTDGDIEYYVTTDARTVYLEQSLLNARDPFKSDMYVLV